ncbi:bis-aminopropyl spermidine synthase family protein [Frankia sp. CcI49]|uniref:bis-aminopropyl spermidine synthase family protein n=1 Tax=Frankia sp. CcI49 TaxID=1745382 RepID=UPI001F5274B3|nr:bis-aminopropyl spermidine synthase family protein [Frankia sp. CcI49]
MTGEKSTVDAVAAFVGGFGVRSRPLREILSLLTRGSQPIEALIALTATPRRAVEDLLRSIGGDLEESPEGLRIRPELTARYREFFGLGELAVPADDQLAGTARAAGLGPAEGLDATDGVGPAADPESAARVRALAALIEGAPAPRRDLDHVAATAPTLARRASWLCSTYDLAGRRVLFVGDHDLTSVALARVCPRADITVVDLDERTLAYIDATARSEGLPIRTLFGDLRFMLPPAAREWADLVFTDPPYTPDGVGLFLGRGLSGLRDKVNGVVVVAYGHSRLHPMLGFQVQQSAQQLGVVFETILPAFNRYHGAQAVGSASDLYVCAPTSRTWKVLDRVSEGFGTRIYTHGRQSVESAAGADRAAGDGGSTATRASAPSASPASPASPAAPASPPSSASRPATVIGETAGPPGARRMGLRVLFAGSDYLRDLDADAAFEVDLTADPGPLLLRGLLAVTGAHARFLVPADHPDVSTPAARAQLTDLLAAKYRLSFPPSSSPSSGGARHVTVEAALIDPEGAASADLLARWLLERAHGRIGNVLREGVIRVAARDGRALSKNEARAVVRALVGEAEQDVLTLTLVETPRGRLERLLGALRAAPAGFGVG